MYNKVKALVLQALGLKDLPVKDGKLNLSQEQAEELISLTGQDNFVESFTKLANQELEANDLIKDAKAAKEQLKALLKENDISASGDDGDADDSSDEGQAIVDAKKGVQGKKEEHDATSLELVKKLEAKIESMEGKIKTLSLDPEPDPNLLIDQTNTQMKVIHSKTHLFASGHSFDAIGSDRPWNKKAHALATGQALKVEATDFTNRINIDRINQDFEDYWRLYRNEVLDIMKDFRGLPKKWEVINNVTDEIGYAALLSGEITQGRKVKWLPKNLQKMVALVAKVYPTQIDAEWAGHELQEMETSWMNRFNKEGSQPYKMSFVGWLMMKLLEKAREEDNIALIKGVYFPDKDTDVPLSYLFRLKGLFQLIHEAKNKHYKPFTHLGLPSNVNIVDYVKKMCEAIPEEKRTMPGLELYMSPTWVRKYEERRKQLDGLMPSFQPGVTTVEGFPNITIDKIDYMDGSDLMFISKAENFKILQNVPTEKSLVTFEKLKREIYAFADYKLGMHVDVFGTQWKTNEPIPDFNHQIFWSNDVELNSDLYIPVPANETTPSAEHHYALKVGVNTGATAITDIVDAKPGQMIYLRGNGTTNASTIADDGNFDLEGNITLSEGVLLQLYVKPDGTFTEISRQVVNEVDENVVVLDPDATTADALDGTHFLTSANTGATAFTNIENAVTGVTYRIEGGSDTNSTSIAASGNFSRISASMPLAEGNWIDVYFNGSKFVELARFVA